MSFHFSNRHITLVSSQKYNSTCTMYIVLFEIVFCNTYWVTQRSHEMNDPFGIRYLFDVGRPEHPENETSSSVSAVQCWHCSHHYKVTNKIQSLTIENMCILRRSPKKNNKKRQGEKLFAHYHDKKAPLSNTAPRETVICKQTCLLIHVKVSLGNLILQVYKV